MLAHFDTSLSVNNNVSTPDGMGVEVSDTTCFIYFQKSCYLKHCCKHKYLTKIYFGMFLFGVDVGKLMLNVSFSLI